jgi:hypothetical protein
VSDASKLTVALYIRGSDFLPEDATALLGLSPTVAWKCGDTRTLPSGADVKAKEGLWVVRFYSEDRPIKDQLAQLMSRVGSAVGKVPGLSGVEDAYFDVFAAPDDASKARAEFAFELDETVLAVLRDTGLPVRFTIALPVQQETD